MADHARSELDENLAGAGLGHGESIRLRREAELVNPKRRHRR
jgi:hypothetical protein